MKSKELPQHSFIRMLLESHFSLLDSGKRGFHRPVKSYFLKLFFFLLIVSLSKLATGQSFELEPEPMHSPEVSTHDWPASWQAEGWIFDQNGKPVEGATVGVDHSGQSAVMTDSTGRFFIAQVQPGTAFTIQKENYLTSTYQSAQLLWFFSENGTGQVEMRLPYFNQRFLAGPQGGFFEGDVKMFIPEGALDKDVEIKVALLPPGYMKTNTNGMVPLSFGAVYFEPSGLQFNLPVRVRQTAIGELTGDNPAPALGEITRNDQGFVLRMVDEANVEVEGMEWSYSLNHFSAYRIIDGNRLVHTEVPPYDPKDFNMDGAANEQDAERILWLEGGTQSFQYELNFKQTQSLTQRESTSTADKHEQTTGTEAGASFGGVKLGTSRQVSLSRANQLAEQLGYEIQVSRSLSYRLNMEVTEYNERCRMVFTQWNFLRFREYVRADHLTPRQKQRFARSYEEFKQPGKEWVHLREVENVSVGQGGFLPGQSLAVRKNADGELEIFAMTNSYVLRTLRGFSEGNCDRFVSSSRQRLRYEDYPVPAGGPKGAATYTLEYKGFFPLEPPHNVHLDMECGNSVSLEIRETRSRMGFSEITATAETTEGTSSSLSASGKINLPYGLGLEGGVSVNTARTQSATNSNSFGSNVSEQDETVLTYVIIDAHDHHLSDHNFYRLFHLYEMRDWYYSEPENINVSDFVRENMRINAKANNRSRGRTRDGGLALLQIFGGKEYWYVAGPPVELIREAGYYLKRVAERPCGEAPMPTVPTPEQQHKPHETVPGQQTTPRETIPGRQQEDAKTPARRSPGQASVPQGFFGGSVSLPSMPSAIEMEENRFWENYNQAVFADPSVFEQLLERFGGEFFPEEPFIPNESGLQLQGSTNVMPGIFAGLSLLNNLEISLGLHWFHNKWESSFPVIVFPFEGTGSLNEQGVLQASVIGIITQISLRYVFSGRIKPYLEAGFGRAFITDSQSNMVLADIELPFEILSITPDYSFNAGAGVRFLAGNNFFIQAGMALSNWPGSGFRPVGNMSAGYLFSR